MGAKSKMSGGPKAPKHRSTHLNASAAGRAFLAPLHRLPLPPEMARSSRGGGQLSDDLGMPALGIALAPDSEAHDDDLCEEPVAIAGVIAHEARRHQVV
jgi:hypothetical protein